MILWNAKTKQNSNCWYSTVSYVTMEFPPYVFKDEVFSKAQLKDRKWSFPVQSSFYLSTCCGQAPAFAHAHSMQRSFRAWLIALSCKDCMSDWDKSDSEGMPGLQSEKAEGDKSSMESKTRDGSSREGRGASLLLTSPNNSHSLPGMCTPHTTLPCKSTGTCVGLWWTTGCSGIQQQCFLITQQAFVSLKEVVLQCISTSHCPYNLSSVHKGCNWQLLTNSLLIIYDKCITVESIKGINKVT